MSKKEQQSLGANKRSVWEVATKPYKGAHFAVFPEELITPCILAGCPRDGFVLDPFMGSGTTAMVALQNGRGFYGCELNAEYAKLQGDRLGLFASSTEWIDVR
jgi:site-specific DNA-methyltransferase (cytosine-N4-specific)